MKTTFFTILISLSSIILNAQNVLIEPNGITPNLGTGIPKLSYSSILALSNPQVGDVVSDLTFKCLRLFNGIKWVVLLSSQDSNVQTLTAWKSGGANEDTGQVIKIDTFGNLYVLGVFSGSSTFGNITINSNVGGKDIFLAKYNSSGIIQWVQKAGSDCLDGASGLSIDSNGNIYITGGFQCTATFGNITVNSTGFEDVFLAKYNSNGIIQWVRTAGTGNGESAKSVSVDLNGNIYITGIYLNNITFGGFSLNALGSEEVFLTKYDSNGNVQWAKSIGGSSIDNVDAINVSINGNIFIIGSFLNSINIENVTLNSSDGNMYIAKYDGSGNLQEAKILGRINGVLSKSIGLDNSENVYITGSFESATFGSSTLIAYGNTDALIAKYNSSCTYQWAKKAGGTGYDYGLGITTHSNGSIFITGYFRNIATFGTINIQSLGSTDLFIGKYDTNGNLLWVQRGGGSDAESGVSITSDGVNNIFVLGHFYSSSTFGATNIISSGQQDVFICRLLEN